MKDFYNTTNESGTQLQMFTDKGISQEDKIMVIFKQHYRLTAYECWVHFTETYKTNTPLTSIRRGITNLTDRNRLVMTDIKKVGGYTRDNHTYKLR